MRISGVEVRRYAIAYDPPFRAAWDPVPRATQEAELVAVHSDAGLTGYASGDRLPDAAVLERLLVGLDPRRTEVVRELCETVDFHGARPWTVEVAVWDLVGRALGEPLWRLLGGRAERLLAYASSGELVEPAVRAERVAGLRDRGVRAVKLRFHHDDWRRDVEVVEEVRDAVGHDVELMVDANQGWRMAGDRSARWDVATAAQCARALEPLGVHWLEEPLRSDDVDGYAALRRLTSLRLAGGEMVRHAAEARDLLLRGGVDVIQPDVVLAGGIGGCRRIAALADLCGRAYSPHTWSNGLGLVANLHLALAVSTCPWSRSPTTLRPGARRAATGCSPSRSRSPPTGRSRRRRGRGSASSPTSTRSSATASGSRGAVRIQAAVLHEPGTPLSVQDVELGAPRAGEVLVRVAAAGVCHSDLHLAEGHLGPGRSPAVPGHEGAGVVEAAGPGVTSRAPGDRVAFCFVPSCGTCRACASGRFNLCEIAAAHAYDGTLLDGTSRLALADGRPLRHFNFVSCFATHCVVPAACAVPLPDGLPLWQASLLGCGVVTGVGAVRNAARVTVGDTVCVIGCGGIGLQIVAAARLAGAGRIVAVDRDAAKLALAAGRGATATVDASATPDPAAAVLDLVPGGVDHALEAVGSPATIRLAWDVLRPGATAIVVGITPVGVEVALPALELLSEKGLRGSYYGSSNPGVELGVLAGMAAAGRLELADVVSHVTDLDGIEAAFGRLRRGEGARTVAVADAALAGVDPDG